MVLTDTAGWGQGLEEAGGVQGVRKEQERQGAKDVG